MAIDSLTLESLSEEWDLLAVPITERLPLNDIQQRWQHDGYVIESDVFPEGVLSRYEDEWLRHNGGPNAKLGDKSTYESPGGWDYATPYMDNGALMELACDQSIQDVLQEIIGRPMAVHLNLTGWQSTTRRWHMDQYLNEPYVGGYYAAVWLALDDIDPRSGPFEFIPGSHRELQPLSQDKVRAALGQDGRGPQWPTHSERLLTPLFEEWIGQRKPERFLGRRNQILVWHSRLLHQGSIPIDMSLERRGLIMHYSATTHRPDMPEAIQHRRGGYFFPLGGRQPVR